MEYLGLAPIAWAVAVVVVLAGAVLQSSMGFGLGLVASPILVLLDPSLVPGVVIAMGVPLALLIAWRERTAMDPRVVGWAVVGRVGGSVVGSAAVVALGTRSLSIVFALAILSAVGVSLAGFTVSRSTATMLAAGFVSGLTGTATSVGGPPMALVFQHSSGPELRATLAAFFAFGAVLSVALLAAVGEFGSLELARTATLIPVALAGFAFSGRTNRILDQGYTRTAVLTVATGAAIAILIRSW